MSRPTCTYGLRKVAAFQLISGLDFIHSTSVTHRDIKPNNIVVLSHDPLHVAYIDNGSAMLDQTSIDHMQGTIAYLAPEVMRRKRQDEKASATNSATDRNGGRPIQQGDSGQGVTSPTAGDEIADEPYTNSVDIFSLGLVLYQLILEKPCWWRGGMTEETHMTIIESLRNIPKELYQHSRGDGLTDLIMQMIAWKSIDRPSTKNLLSHQMWAPYKALLEDDEKEAPRKRQRV